MSLLRPKQIDLPALITALNITQIARLAISVPANSLLNYNSTTGVLDYQGYISSKTIYVDKDNSRATDTRTSLSKYNQDFPFRTIQAAINAAANGDLILVLSNTFSENLTLSGTNKVYVIEFKDVTLNGNITLTNDANSSNILIFTSNSKLVGNIITNTNVIDAVIIGDGTNMMEGVISGANKPTRLLLQNFKKISSNNIFYTGKNTIQAEPEVIFKDIKSMYFTNTHVFNFGNLKFENCNIYQDTLLISDAIFLEGGISVGALNSSFESRGGKVFYGTSKFWFKNINDCKFKSHDYCFDIRASDITTKIGYFADCFFESDTESIFSLTVANGGTLFLNKCDAKVTNPLKFIINNSVSLDAIEATNCVHNSTAGFFNGTFPNTYLNNNIMYTSNL